MAEVFLILIIQKKICKLYAPIVGLLTKSERNMVQLVVPHVEEDVLNVGTGCNNLVIIYLCTF